MTGGRLIAAVGIGDEKSAEENRAYGIEWPPSSRIAGGLLALVLGELAAHRDRGLGGGERAGDARDRPWRRGRR